MRLVRSRRKTKKRVIQTKKLRKEKNPLSVGFEQFSWSNRYPVLDLMKSLGIENNYEQSRNKTGCN